MEDGNLGPPSMDRRKRAAFATVAVLLSVLVAGSAYSVLKRRLFVQEGEAVWRTRHDPSLGVTWAPGRLVFWSGVPGRRREFGATNTANSWGFLDVEHELAKPPGVARVLLLGDSYVEGVQVELGQKVGRVLEEQLTRAERPVEVISLAYMGIGTSHLWAFYDALGRDFRPDLVVLLLVNNDLKDNSPELDCREFGMEPAHSREFYFDLDAAGDVVELPPDGNWRAHRREWSGRWDREGAWLSEGSKHWRDFAPFLEANPGYLGEAPAEEPATRYLGVVSEWAFYLPEEEWTPVMRKARILSDASIERLTTDARSHGAAVVMVWASSLIELQGEEHVEVDGRRLVPALQRRVWRRIAERHSVPFLDLVEVFRDKPDPESGHFRIDGHWTVDGHRWAAEAIAEFVEAHDLLQ